MAVIANNIALEALEALGLPTKGCLSLSLRFERDSVVIAHAQYAPDAEQVEKALSIVKRLAPVPAIEMRD